MLFFLFRKCYIFWFFLFSKKFIISYEKVKKQTPCKCVILANSTHYLLATYAMEQLASHHWGRVVMKMLK